MREGVPLAFRCRACRDGAVSAASECTPMPSTVKPLQQTPTAVGGFYDKSESDCRCGGKLGCPGEAHARGRPKKRCGQWEMRRPARHENGETSCESARSSCGSVKPGLGRYGTGHRTPQRTSRAGSGPNGARPVRVTRARQMSPKRSETACRRLFGRQCASNCFSRSRQPLPRAGQPRNACDRLLLFTGSILDPLIDAFFLSRGETAHKGGQELSEVRSLPKVQFPLGYYASTRHTEIGNSGRSLVAIAIF